MQGTAHLQILPWMAIALTGFFGSRTAVCELIDFRDPENVDRHRPIIIAHRGGVVSKDSPQCSAKAIRLAGEQRYDMVELDIQVSKDRVPVVFHDRNLRKACGLDGAVGDYVAGELKQITYTNSDEKIVTLETALRLCQQAKLGVMLDFKSGREDDDFLADVLQLLKRHQLLHAAITFSGGTKLRHVLSGVLLTPSDQELRDLRAGKKLDLKDRFWFGLPKQLQSGDIQKLHAAGALVVPAINTFRYPAESHLRLAKHDIVELREKVDGFQIDSVYFRFLRQKSASPIK